MIERVIVLPIKDNDGHYLSRETREIKSALLSVAGGFSQVRQSGEWQEGGKVYRDSSLRVSVTVTPEQDSWIQAMLPVWCERLRQVCLYTHRTIVSAEFVYPTKEAVSA